VDISEVPGNQCLINAFEMDWESVVVNLITNALWALEDMPAKDRQIKASLRDAGDNWLLSFDDSGCGLEAGTEEFIFHPTFTTKRKRGELDGTGMGLYIVKSFVQDHSNGSINAVPRGILGGAGFSILVPKAET
jgi:C4-dicarboxylate-specific signal transduction histidine kinase